MGTTKKMNNIMCKGDLVGSYQWYFFMCIKWVLMAKLFCYANQCKLDKASPHLLCPCEKKVGFFLPFFCCNAQKKVWVLVWVITIPAYVLEDLNFVIVAIPTSVDGKCIVWFMLLVVITIAPWKQTPLISLKITKENIGWVKVGTRFACKVGTCIQSYLAKWLLNKHLLKDHNLAIEGRKYVCPSTCEVDPRCQDHSILNGWILSDAHAIQRWNE